MSHVTTRIRKDRKSKGRACSSRDVEGAWGLKSVS